MHRKVAICLPISPSSILKTRKERKRDIPWHSTTNKVRNSKVIAFILTQNPRFFSIVCYCCLLKPAFWTLIKDGLENALRVITLYTVHLRELAVITDICRELMAFICQITQHMVTSTLKHDKTCTQAPLTDENTWCYLWYDSQMQNNQLRGEGASD